jgi:hypothetical protein
MSSCFFFGRWRNHSAYGPRGALARSNARIVPGLAPNSLTSKAASVSAPPRPVGLNFPRQVRAAPDVSLAKDPRRRDVAPVAAQPTQRIAEVGRRMPDTEVVPRSHVIRAATI